MKLTTRRMCLMSSALAARVLLYNKMWCGPVFSPPETPSPESCPTDFDSSVRCHAAISRALMFTSAANDARTSSSLALLTP
mgnify:CR=1 FL=1